MFKKIIVGFLVVLVLAVGGFAVVVAMQPEDFRIERQTTMNASPADVFGQVNDFHKWEAWSPWAKLDPQAANSFEGPSEGKDAIFKWSGNKEVGKGQMTILESRPNELVKIKLDFIEPMQDTSTVDFTFKGEGEQTLVTWSMYGKHTFMSKAVCMVMNMDKMVGGDFEKGLGSMKSIVETPIKK